MSATREEIVKRMQHDPVPLNALHKKIVDAARPLIPVLLDAGRTNSAKELDALFFELDAFNQEMHAFVTENMTEILAVIVGSLENGR